MFYILWLVWAAMFVGGAAKQNVILAGIGLVLTSSWLVVWPFYLLFHAAASCTGYGC